jgi:hypothetical protein
MNETTISRKIAEYLNKSGIYHLRLNAGKVKKNGSWLILCPEGTPDRMAVKRGKTVFIEVKRQGEKPTPEQLEAHQRIEKSGGIVLVCDSFESFESQWKGVK